MNKAYLFTLLCIFNTALFAAQIPEEAAAAAEPLLIDETTSGEKKASKRPAPEPLDESEKIRGAKATRKEETMIKNTHTFMRHLTNKDEKKALKMLEKNSINVNSFVTTSKENGQSHYESVLFAALNHKLSEVAIQLIKNGADVNKGQTLSDNSKSRTPLFIACFNGLYECAQALLEKKADCNTITRLTDGAITPLFAALGNKHPEIALLLIAHGADVNKGETLSDGSESMTPLFLACQNGLYKCAQALLEKKADYNAVTILIDGRTITPLFAALCNKHPEIALLLIAHGADVNKAETLSDVSESMTPLFLACQNGLYECTQTLLEKKADCNAVARFIDGRTITPLFAALSNKHPEIALLLIAHGADVNKGETLSDGSESITPLLMTCKHNLYECAQALLEKKADCNTVTRLINGSTITPLFAALRNKDSKIGLLFIAHGADVNKGQVLSDDSKSITPLFLACQNGLYECAQALLEKKADCNAVARFIDGVTITPLFITLYNQHSHTARLLLSHGADPRIVSRFADGQPKGSSYHLFLNKIPFNHQDYEPLFNLFHKKFREPHGNCSVCLCPPDKKDIVVTPCCNQPIDTTCMTGLLRDRIALMQKKQPTKGCPHCRNRLFDTFPTPIHHYVEAELSKCSELSKSLQ